MLMKFFFFVKSPEGPLLVLGAVITSCVGLALGMSWVPWAAAVVLLGLVLTSTDDDDPQHPVLS